MSCPSMERLARETAGLFRHYTVPVKHSLINWGNFSDGFPDTRLDARAVRNSHIWFLADFSEPTEIFQQLAVIYALPRYRARSLKIFLPFYPTGTMERVDKEGAIATAMTLARMLGAIPLAADGPAKIFILDIHALPERFYFSDNVIPCLETAVPALTKSFSNWSVAFPDEGAWKRFGRTLARFPQILCHKVRNGELRTVSIKEGEVDGKDILIVDDLTRTGKTLLEAAAALKIAGAGKINLVVPHVPLEPAAIDGLIEAHDSGLINRLYTTDSCPSIASKLVKLNLDFIFVLSLAETLRKIMDEEEF